MLLSDSGHDVTIFDSASDAKPAKLDFNATIVHSYLPAYEPHQKFVSTFFWDHDPHAAVTGLVHKTADEEMGRLLLQRADKFVELLKYDYNLVIVDELSTIYGMTIAKMLKELKGTPYVIFTTPNVGAESNVAELALGHTPVLDATRGTILPSGHGDVYDQHNFLLRVDNVLEAIGEYAALNFLVPSLMGYDNPIKLGVTSFDTFEIVRNSEMNLRESLDRLGRIAPIGDDFRSVGEHCKETPSMPKDLLNFVEDPTSEGTIYIAFGTIVNFNTCPHFVFEAFFNAMNQFPTYRIIMSTRNLTMRTLPKLNDNVKIVHWAPQNAILAHPKTKLFMTHGGLKSFKEALCGKTPVVFMPISAEQGMITRVSMKMGLGTALSKYTVTADAMVKAFNEILYNSTYKENMEKTYGFFLDRIIPSLDEGAWYVDKLIRRVEILGLRAASLPNDEQSLLFFRRRGISLPSYKYFGFDWMLAGIGIGYLLAK
uniref:UDP-glucuronosyltransferase n=1 Tax=Panagrolaimus superbus TaxID=310955 RepID=A0A914YQD1_9BILA